MDQGSNWTGEYASVSLFSGTIQSYFLIIPEASLFFLLFLKLFHCFWKVILQFFAVRIISFLTHDFVDLFPSIWVLMAFYLNPISKSALFIFSWPISRQTALLTVSCSLTTGYAVWYLVDRSTRCCCIHRAYVCFTLWLRELLPASSFHFSPWMFHLCLSDKVIVSLPGLLFHYTAH